MSACLCVDAEPAYAVTQFGFRSVLEKAALYSEQHRDFLLQHINPNGKFFCDVHFRYACDVDVL